MENRKIVYGSTGDFLKYLSARTKEKEKNNNGKFSRGASQYSASKKPLDTNRLSFE